MEQRRERDGERKQNDTQQAAFVPWSVLSTTYSCLTESSLSLEAVVRPISQQEKLRHRTDVTSSSRHYFSDRTQAHPSILKILSIKCFHITSLPCISCQSHLPASGHTVSLKATRGHRWPSSSLAFPFVPVLIRCKKPPHVY